jgi:hypothetical protein
MMTLPEVIERKTQHYVYVPFTVRMDQMQKPADEGFPQIFAYLDKHGLEPEGAAFYNYRRINMAETLDVEAGIAVRSPGPEDGAVRAGLVAPYQPILRHGGQTRRRSFRLPPRNL